MLMTDEEVGEIHLNAVQLGIYHLGSTPEHCRIGNLPPGKYAWTLSTWEFTIWDICLFQSLDQNSFFLLYYDVEYSARDWKPEFVF